MRINSVSGADSNNKPESSGIGMQMDSVSRDIQRQIENAQNRLKELSEDKEMSLEEKMKKRQEIQQEITGLRQQLRQHQIEQRKEQQMEKSVNDDMSDNNQNTSTGKSDDKGGFSKASMQAMICADSSLKIAEVQGSVAKRLEGTAAVLESEIKMDKSRGINTEKKEEDLADVESRAQKASENQTSSLSDANKVMAETAKEEKEEDSDSKNSTDNSEEDEQEMLKRNYYTPVDIRL